MAHILAYDALTQRPGPAPRPRPPDIHLEDRVPLNSQKSSRRESRLGLRSIFGRSKTSTSDAPSASSHSSELSSTTHSRPASIAPGSSPYGQGDSSSQLSISSGLASIDSSWSPPPLFKAYPRAIRDATLPASTLDADYIVRLGERSIHTTPDAGILPAPDQPQPRTAEKVRKKHRQTLSLSTAKMEWVTKIYVLETSGYLLQYAAEGPHDRIPEKILRLGKTSAAFASDVIPGRHWVLQVSSTMDSEPQPAEPRSLLSKLHLRSAEKRTSVNMLMIFENAEDMDQWMTILRREIERLGGKKSLSETGKPREDEEVLRLETRPSLRQPISRDTNRYSQYAEDHFVHAESPLSISDADGYHDPVLDDKSTTDSLVSQDERQLNNLRDSAHRLSYISSGQRTIVTSAGSSPACSPSQETFNIPPEELSPKFEARLRPNASAILNRRSSMQTLSPFVNPDTKAAAQSTPDSSPQLDGRPSSPDASRPTPNFSVPRSSKRFSTCKPAAGSEIDNPWAQLRGSETLPRVSNRKPPPTQLRSTRPLSMVMDLPSPQLDVADRPATRHEGCGQQQPTDRVPPPPGSASRGRLRQSMVHSTPRPRSPVQFNRSARGSPRRMVSLGAMKEDATHFGGGRGGPEGWASPPYAHSPSLRSPESDFNPSPISARALKRASMHSMVSDRSSRTETSLDNYASFMTSLPPLRAPPPLAPLPPIPASAPSHHLQVDAGSKALLNRRSMPQLMEGPPPAPPPMRALPAIPQRDCI